MQSVIPTNRKIYREASLSFGSKLRGAESSNSEVGGLSCILIAWFMSQGRADRFVQIGVGKHNNVQEFVVGSDIKHVFEETDGSLQQDFYVRSSTEEEPTPQSVLQFISDES